MPHLILKLVGTKRKSIKDMLRLECFIFMIITGAGLVTGNWQNDITEEEFLYHHKDLNTYGHPTSTESVKKFNEEQLNNSNSSSLNDNEANKLTDPLS